MRRLLLRILWNPWGFRLVCGATFLAFMIPFQIGLKALKATHDSVLIYGVCIPTIAGFLLLAWWMDRKGWS